MVQDSQGVLLGIVLILSIFLLAIAVRAWRKSHIRAMGFLAGSFVAVIIGDIFLSLAYLGYISTSTGTILAMLFLVVLLIFYYGVMRGIS
ncbi:MAG: hypothetical protein ACP5NK_04690 [Thermoplasmata archaeon]